VVTIASVAFAFVVALALRLGIARSRALAVLGLLLAAAGLLVIWAAAPTTGQDCTDCSYVAGHEADWGSVFVFLVADYAAWLGGIVAGAVARGVPGKEVRAWRH
jgi:hypothetical protein